MFDLRPLHMFYEPAKLNGKEVQRFTKITDPVGDRTTTGNQGPHVSKPLTAHGWAEQRSSFRLRPRRLALFAVQSPLRPTGYIPERLGGKG